MSSINLTEKRERFQNTPFISFYYFIYLLIITIFLMIPAFIFYKSGLENGIIYTVIFLVFFFICFKWFFGVQGGIL
jgi:hypothetical protein